MKKPLLWGLGIAWVLSAILLSCGTTENYTRVEIPNATYVGSNKCEACHDTHSETILGTRHWMKNDGRTPISNQGCESCHGPGSVHVENQKQEKKGVVDIISFSKKSAIPAFQQNEQCLQCHQGDRSHWSSSAHHRNDVSCASCHQAHGKNDKQLAAKNELQLCAQCHQDKAAQMERVSHHPVREGRMTCSSCHDPHGTGSEANIKAASVNDLCFKCHTEKRGPHVFEHPPVAENCSNCHDPHGSTHGKLLKANMPFLCQQCHSNSNHPGTLYSQRNTFKGVAPSNRVFADGCINCHSNIHGSNHPSGKTLTR